MCSRACHVACGAQCDEYDGQQMGACSLLNPVCIWCIRIMDWGKFMHEQQKKADAADKARRQAQKLATPKEMQFSARIAGAVLQQQSQSDGCSAYDVSL